MAICVDPIDAIARREGRDVFMVRFFGPPKLLDFDHIAESAYMWESLPARKRVISWLEKSGISWEYCYGPWADGVIQAPYRGYLYVDVPLDQNDERCRQLTEYFEHPDGTMRDPDVVLCFVRLEDAKRNAHHDDPEWDPDD